MRDPFDLVRDWFVAYNRGDLAALGGYYAEAASLEHEDGRAEDVRASTRPGWRDSRRGGLASTAASAAGSAWSA